jgi:hypothetical protein
VNEEVATWAFLIAMFVGQAISVGNVHEVVTTKLENNHAWQT